MPYRTIIEGIPKLMTYLSSMLASLFVSKHFLNMEGIWLQVQNQFVLGPLPAEFFVPLVFIYGAMGCSIYSLFVLLWEIKSRADRTAGHVNMNAYGFILLFFLPPVAGLVSMALNALVRAGLSSAFNLTPGPKADIIVGLIAGFVCVNFIDPKTNAKVWENIKSKIPFLK